jgi:oxepin-CoA hydrolase/3-oxo-5,6-dehydrosuberyl-CoA semialdehyde dehydrogenase
MDSRFLKPVYPGSTFHPGLDPGQVKFTCRENLDQEKRTPEDVAKGIVKFLVDLPAGRQVCSMRPGRRWRSRRS